MGLAPLMLFATTLLIVRNQRILHAWNTRQEEGQRRAAEVPRTSRTVHEAYAKHRQFADSRTIYCEIRKVRDTPGDVIGNGFPDR